MNKRVKEVKKKKNLPLIITIVSIFVIGLGLVVWQLIAGSSQQQKAGELTGYVVQVQEPLLLEGTVVTTQESTYSYNMEKGEIVTVHVTEGQEVAEGQALYEYHNEMMADELEDMYRQQTRLYNQRETTRENIQEQEDKRWQYVVDMRDQMGDQTAEIDTQTFDSTIDSLEATLDEQTTTIEDLEAKIVRAEENTNEIVVADHAGIVSIDPAGQKNAALPFIKVSNNATVIHTQISEYEYNLVAKDQPVTVYVNALDREINATITSVATASNAADAASIPAGSGGMSSGGSSSSSGVAYYEVKVTPLEAIQNGFTVQVRVPQNSVIVPEDAVVTIDGKEYVYLYKDGVAKQQAITRVKQGFQKVVTEGLVVDDVVIVSPNESVTDGAAVTVDIPQKEESSAQ